jgi:hypothetical protein
MWHDGVKLSANGFLIVNSVIAALNDRAAPASRSLRLKNVSRTTSSGLMSDTPDGLDAPSDRQIEQREIYDNSHEGITTRQ